MVAKRPNASRAMLRSAANAGARRALVRVRVRLRLRLAKRWVVDVQELLSELVLATVADELLELDKERERVRFVPSSEGIDLASEWADE